MKDFAQIQALVAKATVTITKKGGRGVLVPGGLILTAAHCITFNIDGDMTLGGFYIEDIEGDDGRMFKVRPLAVEPMADIAVLGALDDQAFDREMTRPFEDFCQGTKPVRVSRKEFRFLEEFPVIIYTHKRAWIAGMGSQAEPEASMLFIKTSEPVEGGTSGSPVISEAGELVALVSTGTCEVTGPRPRTALPVWVRREIEGRRRWKAVDYAKAQP